MVHLHPLYRLVAVALAAACVAACDFSGIGDGSKPEKLEIIRDPRTTLLDTGGEDREVFYLCIPEALQPVATFSSGAIDASELLRRRVRWSSSNPAVVEVSNGDIFIPGSDSRVFDFAQIVPRSVGTATITAEFVGLVGTLDVEIRDIDSVQVSKTEVRLAPETGDLLKLTALIDGYQLDLVRGQFQIPLWSFEEEGDDVDDIAVIGESSGIVTGVGLGGPLTAVADLPLCRDNPKFNNLKASVTVEPLTDLQLAREFTDAPNDELIVGTTERLVVTGRFSDGTTLDLSGQVRVESSDNEVIAANLVFSQFVSALKTGTSQIRAIYGGDDGNDDEGDTDPPEVQSNAITLNAVDGEFQSFTIAPQNATINAKGSQQFTATGVFNVSGETRTQLITRGVFWSAQTLDDKATADVGFSTSTSTATITAGLLTSAQPVAGAYKITATRGVGDDAVSQSTALCVKLPNTNASTCPPPDGNDEGAAP